MKKTISFAILHFGVAFTVAYLLTGELLTATRAAEIGLINHALPADQLDDAVDACCAGLLAAPQLALRHTKMLTNMELRRLVELMLDRGLALECETVRSADHAEAVQAMIEKRPPRCGRPG